MGLRNSGADAAECRLPGGGLGRDFLSGGAFPTWLAPEQARVLPISDKFLDYAEGVQAKLSAEKVRAGIDRSDERIQAKIKAGAEMKIPYLLIVGGKDQDAGTVSVRQRGAGDKGAVPLDDFVRDIVEEIRERRAFAADESGTTSPR